jgi:hypothetical protein
MPGVIHLNILFSRSVSFKYSFLVPCPVDILLRLIPLAGDVI